MPDVIACTDCVAAMRALAPGSVNLIFADPPYNIGYAYDAYDDNRSPDEYLEWCKQWLAAAYAVLADDGSFWVAIGDEYAAEMKILAKGAGFIPRSWVIWYYTFGVNSPTKFTRSHAHLLYFTKSKNFVFNAAAIAVPSARQAVYKDKRAKAGGRVPDDTWILRPQELPEQFAAIEDVWHIPRVAGTFKERVKGATNQLPEPIVERVVLACSNPGDIVLDPFCGSGTTAFVAKRLGRGYITYDVSEKAVAMAVQRVQGVSP